MTETNRNVSISANDAMLYINFDNFYEYQNINNSKDIRKSKDIDANDISMYQFHEQNSQNNIDQFKSDLITFLKSEYKNLSESDVWITSEIHEIANTPMTSIALQDNDWSLAIQIRKNAMYKNELMALPTVHSMFRKIVKWSIQKFQSIEIRTGNYTTETYTKDNMTKLFEQDKEQVKQIKKNKKDLKAYQEQKEKNHIKNKENRKEAMKIANQKMEQTNEPTLASLIDKKENE